MPVHAEMTSAISFSVTSSESSLSSSVSAPAALRSSSFFSSSGKVPYFSLASFSRSYCLSASSISSLMFSICALTFLTSRMSFFSFSHCAFMAALLSLSSASSFSRASSLALEPLSSSFMRACFSISSCMILREISSSSDGMLSISVLILAAASSIRSMALSGRNLSVMYLSESVAHAIRALSVILTP